MPKCSKIAECEFYRRTFKRTYDPIRPVWLEFCQRRPSRCLRLRRDRLVSVGESGNKVTPLGFDLDAMMGMPERPGFYDERLL